jgi:hypothetical protein
LHHSPAKNTRGDLRTLKRGRSNGNHRRMSELAWIALAEHHLRIVALVLNSEKSFKVQDSKATTAVSYQHGKIFQFWHSINTRQPYTTAEVKIDVYNFAAVMRDKTEQSSTFTCLETLTFDNTYTHCAQHSHIFSPLPELFYPPTHNALHHLLQREKQRR